MPLQSPKKREGSEDQCEKSRERERERQREGKTENTLPLAFLCLVWPEKREGLQLAECVRS